MMITCMFRNITRKLCNFDSIVNMDPKEYKKFVLDQKLYQRQLAMIKNIIIDDETGQVIDLIIHPDSSFDTSGYRLEGEKLYINFEAVKDIKDYIVVDRYLSRK